MAEMETWKNASRGRVVIRRMNERMGKYEYEMVGPGQTFVVSEEHRRQNSFPIGAAEPALDSFANGTLVPVRLVEHAEDFELIKSNPNLMGEAEMAATIKGHPSKLKAALKRMDNPAAVRRLKEIAIAADATVSKTAMIEDRLNELDPEPPPIDEVQGRRPDRD